MEKGKSLILALAVGVLSSCSATDNLDQNDNFPSDGVIRVATDLNSPSSRGGQDNDNFTKFNLKIENPSDASYSYYAYMKYDQVAKIWDSYKASDTNDKLTMLWKDNTTAINVTALGVNGYIDKANFDVEKEYSVRIEQNKADSIAASDVLYMKPTLINPSNSADVSGGKLILKIPHLLSKLQIDLMVNGLDVTNISQITDFKVCGTLLKYSFNPSTGKFGHVSSDVARDIKAFNKSAKVPKQGDFEAIYECILVPQTVIKDQDFSLSFKIDGKLVEWTPSSDITFNAGQLLTLKVLKEPQKVTLKALSSSKWESDTAGYFKF